MTTKNLASLIRDLPSHNQDHFPWVLESVNLVSEQTLYEILDGGIEVSNEDYTDLEASLKRRGYKEFLSKEDLFQIIENVRQQKPSYNSDELFSAINHYWKNDAFINFSNI